jgi:hypothetical protein
MDFEFLKAYADSEHCEALSWPILHKTCDSP